MMVFLFFFSDDFLLLLLKTREPPSEASNTVRATNQHTTINFHEHTTINAHNPGASDEEKTCQIKFTEDRICEWYIRETDKIGWVPKL